MSFSLVQSVMYNSKCCTVFRTPGKRLFGNTVSQKALDDAALKVSKAKTQFSQEDYKITSIKISNRLIMIFNI